MFLNLKSLNLNFCLFKSNKIFLSTPMNLNFWWNLGSLLGVLMVIQIFSGFLMTIYYENSNYAFFSVWIIHLETFYGSLIHHTHLMFSSFIFFFLYAHLLKSIWLGSFIYLKLVWLVGCMILILTMGVAFLGYVLPWGQMSLWGATVITNLISVLPYGETLCLWVWGGYFVSSITLKLFFSFHFILPFILLMFILSHLILLHYKGSSNSLGGNSPLMKNEFLPVYLYKDLMNMILIFFFFVMIYLNPYMICDPENFMQANLMISPIHIKPEWYFLQYYAMLRAIPNKLGGVIMFFFSILLLFILSSMKSNLFLWNFKIWFMLSALFVSMNFTLLWAGGSEVSWPQFEISQIFTLLYFFWFILLFFFLKIVKF